MNPGQTPSEEMIDRCMAAIQTQGRSVEDCLVLYPAERAELEPLLRLALRLQGARSLQAPAEFKAAAPLRLKQLAAARPRPRRRILPASLTRQPRLRFSPLLAGLLIAVLIASAFGTAAVSARALPGDFLYPVKRAQESLQLSLTADEAQRAGLVLDYANRRIDEAVGLVNSNRAQSIDPVVSEYNEQIQAELAYLQKESRLSAAEQADLAGRLLAEAAGQEASLAYLSGAAPAAVQAKIDSARTTSQQVVQQAAQIMKNQPNGKPVPSPLPTHTPGVIHSPAPTSTPLPSATPLPPKPSPVPPTQVTRLPGPGTVPLATRTPAVPPPPPSSGPPPASPTVPPNISIRTQPPTLTLGSGVTATRLPTLPPKPSPTPNLGTGIGKTPTKPGPQSIGPLRVTQTRTP